MPKHAGEVPGVGLSDTAGDLVDRQVGLGEQLPSVDHAPFGDPVHDGAAGAPPHQGGQVTGRHPDALGHVAEGQRFGEPLLDHVEHLGQQGLVAAPQVAHHVGGQACDVDEQQRQVRQCGLPVSLVAVGQFSFDCCDRGRPHQPPRGWHVQPKQSARNSVQERKQQRVSPPGGPRRLPVPAEGGRIEKHPATRPVNRGQDGRVDHLARGHHVHIAVVDWAGRVPRGLSGSFGVHQDWEVVDVALPVARQGVPVEPQHRNRRDLRGGPVPVDRHPGAVARRPRHLRHGTKNTPTSAKNRPTTLLSLVSPWNT